MWARAPCQSMLRNGVTRLSRGVAVWTDCFCAGLRYATGPGVYLFAHELSEGLRPGVPVVNAPFWLHQKQGLANPSPNRQPAVAFQSCSSRTLAPISTPLATIRPRCHALVAALQRRARVRSRFPVEMKAALQIHKSAAATSTVHTGASVILCKHPSANAHTKRHSSSNVSSVDGL